MTAEIIKKWKCFDGIQYVYRHQSRSTGTEMQFAAFVPDHKPGEKLASLTFLSGLTCTWENFTTKAGAQKYAAQNRMILIMPDTSPRGAEVADTASYSLGQGAGFYVDATQSPWSKNFRMFEYINMELYALLPDMLPIDESRRGISGHSMGGHGALISAFRHPGLYRSLSAFSPVCAPMECEWGQQAFTAYLGTDERLWENYDASKLALTTSYKSPLLIDIGKDDEYVEKQLKPQFLQKACKEAGFDLQLNFRDGYDHSYYFISSFIGEHIQFHAGNLK
jgi:S-formylglutathione hydrolase